MSDILNALETLRADILLAAADQVYYTDESVEWRKLPVWANRLSRLVRGELAQSARDIPPLNRKFTIEELQSLSREQLQSFGFRLWSKESDLMLIPLWMVGHIEADYLWTIFGTADYNWETSLDTRGGVISSGFFFEEPSWLDDKEMKQICKIHEGETVYVFNKAYRAALIPRGVNSNGKPDVQIHLLPKIGDYVPLNFGKDEQEFLAVDKNNID